MADNRPLVRAIKSRFESMKTHRGTWETHWQEVADFVLTRKNTITTHRFPGEKRNTQVFSDVAVQSNELLAGALHGLLTNPTVKWFGLTTGLSELDDDDEVRVYLQLVESLMHNVLNNSNFQTEIHEIYIDLGAFGTSALLIEEDDDFVVRFSARPIGEIFIDENNKGLIDTLFRHFMWDVRKIRQEFGEDALTPEHKKALMADPARKFNLVHAMFPREDLKILGSKGMPIASIWIDIDEEVLLSESGFRQAPFAIPRWTKATGEMYGRSPAIKSLASIKMHNEMWKTTIKGAQKAVDPPLLVPDDGAILPVRTTPGGLNFFRAGTTDRIAPLLTGTRVDIGIDMINLVGNQIRQAFFIDQLQLGEGGPQMTAREVIQRTEERMRFLGPILGRQESELLRPLIDRLFDIMGRKKLLPVVPEILKQAGKIDVKYSSLIARAQRATEAENILRSVEAAAPFIQADPAVMDNYNGDKAARLIARLFSAPQEIMRDNREIEKIRAQRQQAQQDLLARQQQSVDIQDGATVAKAANQLG